MGDRTSIEWADASWPIVTGCTHISDGCDHCYAATLTSTRLKHLPEYAGLAENGRFNGAVRCLEDRLDWPLRWRKPRKVFVSDMADLFHPSVPDLFLERAFDVMEQTPRHTFQVLTKRHARMRAFMRARQQRREDYALAFENNPIPERRTCPAAKHARWCADNPPPNIWLGVSAENQKWADIRIPALLETPAAVRFLSCEPLLGSVDLHDYLAEEFDVTHPYHDAPCGAIVNGMEQVADEYWIRRDFLHWVIAGGESGPGARRCELGWIEEIVNACHQARVPVFVKQLGKVLGAEFGAGPKGGDIDRWPAYLQHRHFPRDHEAVAAL